MELDKLKQEGLQCDERFSESYTRARSIIERLEKNRLSKSERKELNKLSEKLNLDFQKIDFLKLRHLVDFNI